MFRSLPRGERERKRDKIEKENKRTVNSGQECRLSKRRARTYGSGPGRGANGSRPMK